MKYHNQGYGWGTSTRMQQDSATQTTTEIDGDRVSIGDRGAGAHLAIWRVDYAEHHPLLRCVEWLRVQSLRRTCCMGVRLERTITFQVWGRGEGLRRHPCLSYEGSEQRQMGPHRELE